MSKRKGIISSIRSCIDNLKAIPEILNSQEGIIKSLVELREQISKQDVPGVSFVENSLDDVRDLYEEDLRTRAIDELSRYKDDMEACFVKYDQLLYGAINEVQTDYRKLAYLMAKLDVLKSYISKHLFGEEEVFSFYFYIADTSIMRSVISEIPAIDIDKLFLIKLEEIVDSDVVNSPTAKYVAVSMTKSTLEILSPTTSVSFSTKYRKTVLRVLYSLYTDKYYIYHLD